ncbi:MAG: protein-glutamate O-methyltransferase CheR [Pirellulaceae bacterium]|jgi:chemotaxis protein methyltransferase CheR|nr:protein-glutamate O-methyltransferase CheR [Pirellulaceae bacterium]
MRLSPTTFEELRRLIHGLCGLVLGPDKAYLIHHRLEPLMRQQGIPSFEDLCVRLRQLDSSQLRDALVEAITTRETSFFRDRHVFDGFRRHALPQILNGGAGERGNAPPLRLWSAGVSTGQEAFSLAILLYEHAASISAARTTWSVVASDISASALELAQRAEYRLAELRRGLTPEEVSRHFEPHGAHWRVRQPIRQLVEFRRANLMQPFQGLGMFDAIFCRNVLIYFDEAARRAICRQFETMLPAGGWLVLGTAENLYGISDAFVSVPCGEALLYRKRPSASVRN